MSPTTPKKHQAPATPLRILKIDTCPTFSGESTLTYHIGCTPKSDIHIRVYANTGGGFFSPEWVALKDIQKALEKAEPITSIVLYPLLKGRSVNTTAFLLAVLKHEQLIQPLKGKQRRHELMDPKGFLARVNKLIASKVDLKPEDTPRKAPRKTSKKAAIKKRAAISKQK
ncbi:MAG: hypothetical protein IMF03_03880 [Proteobacteria bacterium]|nr:hypothetical protein [Pseudomonadota bacterium]